MPFEVPRRSYILPAGADPASLVSSLEDRLGGTRLDVAQDRPTKLVATLLDTADRRVRDAGAELRLEHVDKGAGDGGRLVLHPLGGRPPVAAEVAPARRYLIQDLPAGALRDSLAPIVGVRALLPLACVRLEVQPLRVLNSDEKTVARLGLATGDALPGTDGAGAMSTSRASAQRGGGTGAVPLPPRAELSGVLGYAKPFARMQDVLGGELGLTEVGRGWTDEAVAALGGDPAGIPSKPRVTLQPDERTDQAAVAVLSPLADVVEANLPGTLDDLDIEFLHDLRVAVRRSRSVLRELRRAFPPAALAEQRDALRWIQEVTGPTRDLDVQLLDEPGFLAPTAGGHDALAPVRELLARQRADAFRLLRRRLRSDTYARRWAAYRSFLATVPTSAEAPGAAEDPTGGDGADGEAADERPDAARPIAQVAGRRIRRVYARMLDMGGAIDDTSPPEALHELRKRGKEQRYLLELFGGLWPSDTVRPMVRRLKDLQDVLGAHQDHEVQAAQLRSLAGELAGVDGGPEALLALGVVVDRLHQAQRASRADFAERFAAFAAADQQRLVSDTFRWPR